MQLSITIGQSGVVTAILGVSTLPLGAAWAVYNKATNTLIDSGLTSGTIGAGGWTVGVNLLTGQYVVKPPASATGGTQYEVRGVGLTPSVFTVLPAGKVNSMSKRTGMF